jgi:hypothetical protein
MDRKLIELQRHSSGEKTDSEVLAGIWIWVTQSAATDFTVPATMAPNT